MWCKSQGPLTYAFDLNKYFGTAHTVVCLSFCVHLSKARNLRFFHSNIISFSAGKIDWNKLKYLTAIFNAKILHLISEVTKNTLHKLSSRSFYIAFNTKSTETFHFIVLMKPDMLKGKILRYFPSGEKNCLNL